MGQTGTALAANSVNGAPVHPDRSVTFSLPADALRQLSLSFKTQWKRYRKRLRRCQKKFSEKAVHGSRVETRRLLALVGLLEAFIPAGLAKKVERALKKHFDTFDDLRDVQVQLPAVADLRRRFAAAAPFHAYLAKREERFAKQTRKCIKRVKTGRLEQLVADILICVEEQRKKRRPIVTSALLLRTINRAFSRTAQLQQRIDPQDTQTIHCTRVAFKKFRYMAERLAEHLPAGEVWLDPMRDYQTIMGDIQDVEVLRQAFDKYLDKKRIPAAAATKFQQELLRRRQGLIRSYLRSAARLYSFWPWDDRLRSDRKRGLARMKRRVSRGVGTKGALR